MRPEPRQLVLDLPVRTLLGRGSFLVAECNEAAVRRLDEWRGWPGRRLVLSGPAGSGKSHLAHVWAENAGARLLAVEHLREAGPPGSAAIAVDGADLAAGYPERERALLHLHNSVLEAGGYLLLTARREPGRWAVALPDLASRILGSGHVRVAPPDDALLRALLVKLFDDRQIVVATYVVDYLAHRMERSFEAARRLVARIDAAALTTGGPVTRSLAAEALAFEVEAR